MMFMSNFHEVYSGQKGSKSGHDRSTRVKISGKICVKVMIVHIIVKVCISIKHFGY
jgi:hypothetical protein